METIDKNINRRTFVALGAVAMLAGTIPVRSALAAGVTIPIIVKDTTSFYWQIVLAGARKAGRDLGVNVPELGAQAETDVNGQISILENAVAGNPAAIVISPTEAKALGKPIDEAASKVKIIGIDSSADSKAFTSFLTTDNVQGGRVAADGLAAAIGEANGGKVEGKVALITALPGAGSLEQRRQGFTEQLKAKYPGLQLIADKYADGQATTGLNIATDLITANPDLKGIFASNLIMAQGVGQAIAENNLAGKVALVGFDSDEKLIKFLNDGVISALVVQDPYRMGYDGIKTALAASKGEKVEEFVDTGANLVTKANMKDPKIDALLNPKLD
jgi:ribose transport system substrate-binding protein